MQHFEIHCQQCGLKITSENISRCPRCFNILHKLMSCSDCNNCNHKNQTCKLES